MARPREPLKERFEKKFYVTPGCWPLIKSKKRYGSIGLGGRGGKNESAHRVSYMLYVGQIPEGMFVLHRCDNDKCVNPEHLFLGTATDNMKDRLAKGRYETGENHWVLKQGAILKRNSLGQIQGRQS